MRILITGGAGFLGTNLAKRALDSGYETLVIDNLSRTGSVDNFKWLSDDGDLKFFNIDIREFDKLNQIIMDHTPD